MFPTVPPEEIERVVEDCSGNLNEAASSLLDCEYTHQ